MVRFVASLGVLILTVACVRLVQVPHWVGKVEGIFCIVLAAVMLATLTDHPDANGNPSG